MSQSDETLSERIEDNAKAPQSYSADGESATQHSLKDQIEVDRYLKGERAKRRGLGIRAVKLVPPGSV